MHVAVAPRIAVQILYDDCCATEQMTNDPSPVLRVLFCG